MEDLLRFFEPGSIVTTRLEKSTDWIVNAVLDLQPDIGLMELNLRNEYIEALIAKGCEIEVRIFSRGYIAYAKGIIKDIIINPSQKIVVEIMSTSKFVDKREEPRFDVNLMSIIKDNQIEYDYISLVRDISRSGLGVISSQNYMIGSELFINIFISDDLVLKLKGSAVRKSSSGYNIEYGISSKPIDEENNKILDELIYKLQQENEESVSLIKKLRAKIVSAN